MKISSYYYSRKAKGFSCQKNLRIYLKSDLLFWILMNIVDLNEVKSKQNFGREVPSTLSLHRNKCTLLQAGPKPPPTMPHPIKEMQGIRYIFFDLHDIRRKRFEPRPIGQ